MTMQFRAVPRGLAFPAAFTFKGRSVSPAAAAANARVPNFNASRLFIASSLVIQHKLDTVQDSPLHVFSPDASISFERLERHFHFGRCRTPRETGEKDLFNNFHVGLSAREQFRHTGSFFGGDACV